MLSFVEQDVRVTRHHLVFINLVTEGVIIDIPFVLLFDIACVVSHLYGSIVILPWGYLRYRHRDHRHSLCVSSTQGRLHTETCPVLLSESQWMCWFYSFELHESGTAWAGWLRCLAAFAPGGWRCARWNPYSCHITLSHQDSCALVYRSWWYILRETLLNFSPWDQAPLWNLDGRW